MMQKRLFYALSALLGVGLLAFGVMQVQANGTETLGPPLVEGGGALPLAVGSGFLVAGVGTEGGGANIIDFTVPGGATVEQALLYWGGEINRPGNGDNEITVNSNTVTGDPVAGIGGPTLFFNSADGNTVDYNAFRADITGLVGPGVNMLTIEDMDFNRENNGAGVIVIYDDGSGDAGIALRDGVDMAFVNFPEPRKSTIPQTYNVGAATVARSGEIGILAGSVGLGRPNSIEVTSGATVIFSNELGVGDPLWDNITLPVTIPAGESQITVQLFSRDDGDSGVLEASMAWIASVISVEPVCGDGQVDPGEFCDDGNDINDDDCRNDCTACGDGVINGGEECDDGNMIDDDDCSNTCEVREEPEGCTPGFYKRPHHWGHWQGYSITDVYDTTFGVSSSFVADQTLLGVLLQGGGGEFALGRHAVAALLNAAHTDIDYFYSEGQVIQIVQDAYASGEFEAAKNLLAAENEAGCPIGGINPLPFSPDPAGQKVPSGTWVGFDTN